MPLGYFGLQLQFAAHVASRRGEPLRHGITHCTNLRRRFGQWGPHGSAAWEAYLQGIDHTTSHDEPCAGRASSTPSAAATTARCSRLAASAMSPRGQVVWFAFTSHPLRPPRMMATAPSAGHRWATAAPSWRPWSAMCVSTTRARPASWACHGCTTCRPIAGCSRQTTRRQPNCPALRCT